MADLSSIPIRNCNKHLGNEYHSAQVKLICLKCKQNRLCCLSCINQDHFMHQLTSLRKFTCSLKQKLYHNIKLQEKSQIVSIIEGTHNQFIEKFSEIKIELNKALYEVQDHIESIFARINASFTPFDYQVAIKDIFDAQDQNKVIGQYINRLKSAQEHRFKDVKTTNTLFHSLICQFQKIFSQTKANIISQMEDFKTKITKLNTTCISEQEFKRQLSFEPTLKSAQLDLSDSRRSVSRQGQTSYSIYPIALVNRPFDPINNRVSFRIEKQGQYRNVMLGVCIVDIVRKSNFLSVNALLKGVYAIDQRNFQGNSAYSINHHDSTFHGAANVGFNFEIGEIITVQVDYQTSMVRFIKGQAVFQMPIKLELGPIHACLSLNGDQDLVSLEIQ